MDETRGNLAHRDEDEVSKVKPRMRKCEEFGVGLLVIIKE